MSDELILLVPEAPAPQADPGLADIRKRAGMLRLGTLDNSKANAEPLLRLVTEALRGQVELKSVVALNKNNASVPARDTVYEQLANESDLVISAMAD